MTKQEIRKQIKLQKKQFSQAQLAEKSASVLAKLEKHPAFCKANIVMLYCSLPDEVQTMEFLQRWRYKKQIILPTVVGDDIIPVKLEDDTNFAEGDFGIQEPQNVAYTGAYDLIIVPGVAFDKNGNRLGRGRGYYDRFLVQHKEITKIGICFDFQLVAQIPTEPTDIAMDDVLSE